MKSAAAMDVVVAAIAELGRPSSRRWAEIGQLLDRADAARQWEMHSSSFSDWLNLISQQIGLKQGSLSRFLRAYRAYQALHQEMCGASIQIPPVEEAQDHLSPENFELLVKIRRGAPYAVNENFIQNFIDGRFSRQDLRSIWKDVRPNLEGRRSRAPKSVASPAQAKQDLLGRLLTEIRTDRAPWLALENAKLLRIFKSVPLPLLSGGKCIIEVVAVTSVDGSFLNYHGLMLENGPSGFDLDPESLQHLCGYFHSLWIAGTHTIAETAGISAGLSIGVLTPTGKGWRVVNSSNLGHYAARRDMELASVLLRMALGDS